MSKCGYVYFHFCTQYVYLIQHYAPLTICNAYLKSSSQDGTALVEDVTLGNLGCHSLHYFAHLAERGWRSLVSMDELKKMARLCQEERQRKKEGHHDPVVNNVEGLGFHYGASLACVCL